MKKLFLMAVAAIAALSSCTSDNELELNQNTGKEALTFTATMEDSEATRATYDNTNQYALWEAGDQISINGVSYSAQEGAGATATFKATTTGVEAEGPFTAYFPADLFDGTTATLPAIQTYEEGKFNMPMYAESETTTLAFKNLCAVLAIKVTSDDITTLKSIKVASDKKMNGTFTVTDKKAVMGTDGTNAVVLESATALTLDETGTTFYIAIPAQEYAYLNIFLSADGKTYTQAMATKKKAGLGAIARSTIFNINYAKNATKMWAGNLLIADCNVGATSPEAYGGYYAWGGSQNKVDDHNTGTDALSDDNDTAYKLWGENWRMPTSDELTTLKGLGAWDGTNQGLLCTGQGDYSSNSVFLPAAGYCYDGDVNDQTVQGYYWASSYGGMSPYGEGPTGVALSFYMTYNLRVDKYSIYYQGYSVRAVLEEAASPAPAAPATTGTATATIGGGNVEVNWVQLWADGPKFAEYNVGATSVAEYGGYYCWGGTYKNGKGIAWDGTYNEGSSVLSGNDDTATALWGSKWRMPTHAELKGLHANCDVAWTDNYNSTGIAGRIFTGKAEPYSSNSIFLPAAGICYEWGGSGDVDFRGSAGYYWPSTLDGSYELCYLNFESDKKYMDYGHRNDGCSVRAVLAE